MRQRVIKFVFAVLAILALLIFFYCPGLYAPPFALCFGWISAMLRYVAVWHPSLSSIIWFSAALATLIVGAHLFLGWLYSSIRGEQLGSLPVNWRWKWTLCGFGAAACSLLAIVCIVLTTHQVFWMSKSSDSLLVELTIDRAVIRSVAQDLKRAAEAEHWDSGKIRAGFYRQQDAILKGVAVEGFEPVWVSGDNQSLRAIILSPRSPLHRSTASVIVIAPDKENAAHPLDELQQVLVSLGVAMNAPGSKRPTLLP